MAWKVVLYCSNHASICSHAVIILSQTRWIVMTGWRTSISRQPVFKHVLDCGSLLFTRISFHLVFQTCLDCGSLSAHTHQYPALCSNTFGLRFCVCVQTSVYSPLTKHVWNVDPCLRTRISFQHCVSNTYGLWFRVWVQASASCFLGQTRLDFGSLLCTCISLHSCLKHVLIMIACLFTSIFVLSQNGYGNVEWSVLWEW